MEITKHKTQSIDNRTYIRELPDDLLNKIIYHTDELIQEKIDKEQSIMKLIDIRRYINNHIEDLRIQLSYKIKEGCVYKISFIKNQTDFAGLYLINTAAINQKNDSINICKVEPDDNNERIFGKYRIVKISTLISTTSIYSYELVYEPPTVNYYRPTLLLAEPVRVYKRDNFILSRYSSLNFGSKIKIIYNREILCIKNHYCLVQVVSVLKDSVKVRLPNDREIITIPKRVLYNTISHDTFGLF
jgi:hypothetical protein